MKAGDTVEIDDSLVTLESDKATMDVPSPAAGTVKALRVKVGDKVSEGSVVLTLEDADAGAAQAPAPQRQSGAQPRGRSASRTATASAHRRRSRYARAARRKGPRRHAGRRLELDAARGHDDRSARSRHRRLHRRAGDRGLRQAGRHREGRGSAGHARVRQGDDGRAGAGRRRRRGRARQGRRHGQRRHAAPDAEDVADRRRTGKPRARRRRYPDNADRAIPPMASAGVRLRRGGARDRAHRVARRRRRGPCSGPTSAAARALPPSAAAGRRARTRRRRCASSRASWASTSRAVSGQRARRAASSQEDVQQFVKARAGGAGRRRGPRGAAGAGGSICCRGRTSTSRSSVAVETKPLSRIRKISGANLARNWVMIPHVTQFDDADITELEAFRVALNKENEKAGIKVTMLAFLIKAGVAALKQVSRFQRVARRRRTSFCKQYFNIGFAADTPNGLVVPVHQERRPEGRARRSRRKWRELSAKAREGKLGPADMQGGCFSISLARRHRRHRVHADHQRARSRDPRRVAQRDEAGVGRQGVRAAADAAAVAVVRPSRDRRRAGGALHHVFLEPAGGFPAGAAVTDDDPGRTEAARRARGAALRRRGRVARRRVGLDREFVHRRARREPHCESRARSRAR